ncbi:galactose oxidase early set domain-containing protein [Streptomyces plumbiresistens]|uniref:Galactose oxidase-like Early set domain-containing protein n=1 Tax=Streptomyces plumbiresistens TaxID=511811 RepID=A0ABP7RXZ1_9ACTN
MSPQKISAAFLACALVSAATATTVFTAPSAYAHDGAHHSEVADADDSEKVHVTDRQIKKEMRDDEAAVLGEAHAKEHAGLRATAKALAEYPQSTRTARLKELAKTQAETNKQYVPEKFGRFAEYFPSPDYGDHIAMLPTGKVLLFSFEPIEDNPQKETAPTDVIGKENAGRAYLWDPAKGTGRDAFKSVPPPMVVMPDGKNEARPAPFFCSGHAFLPNGMLGVFGGNLGGNGGSGAKLSLVFDPWTETWHRNADMSVGRWYPGVVEGPDGRLLIMSGQSELGWGTPTSIVERFPAKSHPVPWQKGDVPANVPVDTFRAKAPFTRDYPHLFTLRDGKVYGLGRMLNEQYVFDLGTETRASLPDRPTIPCKDARDGNGEGCNPERINGSAVPLPNGFQGPDSVLVLGGNRDDANTYELTKGKSWNKREPRAFGRSNDSTLMLPDGKLFTVNGSFHIRNYGNGMYNPNALPKYRHTEARDENGSWRLGPVQRLPRGYHSNAVLMPDGRILVTGDEAQQIANDPDIKDDMHGSIEMFEPWYLHVGNRPQLNRAPAGALRYDSAFTVQTSTPGRVDSAVLVAPTTATHSTNPSQRHLKLKINSRDGNQLSLRTPETAADAPPGWHMLFLLDERGVPSVAKWVKLEPAQAVSPSGRD